MFRKAHLATAGLSGLMMISLASFAMAGPSDITLNRFGECVSIDNGNCSGVRVDEAGFRSFARELGLATSNYALQPAETTGQNGFAVQLNFSNTSISSDQEYWQKANINGEPPSALNVMGLSVRKGLPFSLEVGFNAGLMLDSELVSVGGEVKYALHEDWLWPVPDLAIRAWGNAVLGAKDLGLYNFGADVIASVPIGIGGTVQLTPIVGYSFQAVVSKSNVLNAAPGNPMPPTVNPGGGSHLPEYVFATDTQIIHRMFAGVQLSVAVVDLNFQANFIGDQLTLSGGMGLSF